MGWMQAVHVTKESTAVFGPYPGMDPLPGEVSLTIRYAGVGMEDASFASGAVAGARLPRVPGREIVGCDDLGHFYTAWPLTVCGRCARCSEGRHDLCVRRRMLGVDYDGGWGEYISVPEENLVPLPDELDPVLGVLVEPMARCLCALRELPIEPGSMILASGDMPEAPLAMLAAKHLGMEPGLSGTSSQHDTRFRKCAALVGADYGEACRNRFFDAVVSASRAHASLPDDVLRILPGRHLVLLGCARGAATTGEEFWLQVQGRAVSVKGAWGCRMKDMREAVRVLTTYADAARVLIDRVEFMREIPVLLPKVISGEILRLVACPAADVF